MTIEQRPLGRTGLKVSALGFGASSLGQEFRPVELAEVVPTVRAALDAGITFLDTSPFYGRGASEVLLGFALRDVPRDRYVLCTKLGRYDTDVFDFRPERVRESVHVSLKRLGTDRLDVVLCHDVEFADLSLVVNETLPALQRLKRDGKVRAVGVSGFPLKIFRDLLGRAELDVVLSYGHLTLQNAKLLDLLPDLAAKGVGVMNAAPWAMRLLTDMGAPPWHKATPEVRAVCKRAAEHARSRGSDLAKLALQFAVRQPGVATTIAGTASPYRVRQWTGWLAEPVDEALLGEIRDLLRPVQGWEYVEGRPENNDVGPAGPR